LADGALTATELAARIYRDTPAALLPAASRNVFAHLVDLTGKTRVAPESELGFDGGFTLSAGS
ncbi:MAG: MBL fold metallo-hydrolase, partial [Marinovum algicola]